jgi:broad specificity phosphatase PhoE
MTNLVLVRHGETIWLAENRYCGVSDIALTARGYQQAELLANWAATAGLAAVWTSPLSRARETAAPVARVAGVTPQTDARLCEIDFGQGEGRTAAEMEHLFPGAWAAFLTDPVANYLPDGEDPRAAAERAIASFVDIARAYPEARVLVVAHTTLIRLALCRLIGVPLARYRRIFPFIRNGALTEIRLDGAACRNYQYSADELAASLMQFNSPIELGIAPAPTQTSEAQATP